MKKKLGLRRSLRGLFVAGISIFALSSAYAADAPKVNANNYVRTESDFQMKAHNELLDSFGKLVHRRKAYNVNN